MIVIIAAVLLIIVLTVILGIIGHLNKKIDDLNASKSEEIKELKYRLQNLINERTIEKMNPLAEEYRKLMKYESFEGNHYRGDTGVKYHFITGEKVIDYRYHNSFERIPVEVDEEVIIHADELEKELQEKIDLKKKLCNNKCKKKDQSPKSRL